MPEGNSVNLANVAAPGSSLSTCLIVFGSSAGGMLLSLLQAVDAATRTITGPQATLICCLLGLLVQCIWRWLDRRRAAKQ